MKVLEEEVKVLEVEVKVLEEKVKAVVFALVVKGDGM